MNDSIETYSSQNHAEPMISFLLLKNIDKALTYNAGLPETMMDFLREATKVLKREDHYFEYLEVYSEVTKDAEGNEKKEFIVESDEIIRLGNTSKIKLFNRLSLQGWILDFKDDDGHYIFKRSSHINMPIFLGHQPQNKEFYSDASLNLQFSQLHLNASTIKYLEQLGIITIKDLLDTVKSIDELGENLLLAITNNQNMDIDKNLDIREIELDINRLKDIFEQDKKMSLQEVVFAGFLTPIEVLDLSIRGYNCLRRAQIYVVADLIKYSFKDLLEIKNMNRRAAAEIRQILKQKLDLSLAYSLD